METDLDERIVAALRRITRAIDLHSRDLLQQHGLTTPQLVTLRELVRLQPVPVGVLAEGVHVSQATMTGILDRLERRNLIERVRDDQDRRSVVVAVTDEGSKFLETAPSSLQEKFRSELALMPEWEQSSMLAMLQRIATMMGAADLQAAPILVTGAESLLGNANPTEKNGESAISSGDGKATTRVLKNDRR